jgi:hypothetical protein
MAFSHCVFIRIGKETARKSSPMAPVRTILIALLVCTVLVPAADAALSVALGDEVVLTGTNPGGQTLYLFLTGPNLPQEGARLEDASPVITGSSSSFTRAEVLADGTWRYKWDTKGVSGIIDTGSYILFAVTEPAGRQDLSGKEYTSLGVTLRKPGITVLTATTTSGKDGQGTAPGTPSSSDTARSPGSVPLPGGMPVPVPVEVPCLACIWAILFFGCFRR